MRTFIIALLLMLFIITPCVAKTPDGQTPHEENVCDGETGVAFGLCNAYCEAMDCDSLNPHASEKACSKIKNLYIKRTGNEYLPCEQTIEQLGCPCSDYIPEFADFLENIENFEYCYDYRINNEIFIQIGDRDSISVTVNKMTSNLEPPICAYHDGSWFSVSMEITEEELESCMNMLLEKIDEARLSCWF